MTCSARFDGADSPRPHVPGNSRSRQHDHGLAGGCRGRRPRPASGGSWSAPRPRRAGRRPTSSRTSHCRCGYASGCGRPCRCRARKVPRRARKPGGRSRARSRNCQPRQSRYDRRAGARSASPYAQNSSPGATSGATRHAAPSRPQLHCSFSTPGRTNSWALPHARPGLFTRPRAPRFIAIAQGSARAAGSLSHCAGLNEKGFVERKWACRDPLPLDAGFQAMAATIATVQLESDRAPATLSDPGQARRRSLKSRPDLPKPADPIAARHCAWLARS